MSKNKKFYLLLLTLVSFACQGQSPGLGDELIFVKQQVFNEFKSEGVATADVNKDGLEDILAGPYWFEAPNWIAHEIRTPGTFDYTKGYSQSFLNFTSDINDDGWVDFIIYGFPGEPVRWYENPKGQEGHWKESIIDEVACNESPMMADVNGSGRLDLVFARASDGIMRWQQNRPSADNTFWTAKNLSRPKSPGTEKYSHGLGLGDINGDGRNDLIIKDGWWEAPENREEVPWVFHAVDLGEASSQMYAYDFDQDGDQDVVSSSAHDYGIWWHEQVQDELGNISFNHHLISDAFSQSHSLVLKDLNADGKPDLITGKRYFAHQGHDPGGTEPAVLYWFQLTHDNKGNPSWIPHMIDDNSGAGLNTVIIDMNKDGKLDIVTANKKGVFLFAQE